MHVPVLTKEVIEYLDPKGNENFVDCTLGFTGHTKEILRKTRGKVLGIEISEKIAQRAEIKRMEGLIVVNDSYINLKSIVKKKEFAPINGILFDLGFSSWHLEGAKAGFSFQKDEFLDMRFSHQNRLTAYEIINHWEEEEISDILKEYGEERSHRRIAEAIVTQRKKEKIKTTFQLVELIEKVIPRRGKINPATKTFQALRIRVNDELNVLKKGLQQAVDVVDPGGRIVVISFHSLEDRIVKHFFKEREDVKILTKKPITATEEEIRDNPRSRSAKLRAIIKL